MYEIDDDVYCYPGTTVLKNRRNLRTQAALTRFETAMTAQRFLEPLPAGQLNVQHYRAVHRHLFQDVYAWAGRPRTVRIAKDGNAFCYPENIQRESTRSFAGLGSDNFLAGLSNEDFARKAATFLATLNAIHMFRDGNGRAQLAFMAILADAAGHPLHFDRLEPEMFLRAMIRSFHGDEGVLAEQLARLL
jgi:cell filamentation protein